MEMKVILEIAISYSKNYNFRDTVNIRK